MRRLLLILVLLASCILPTLASADTIYSNDPPVPPWGGSFMVGRDQWLAKRIYLDNPSSVGSISVYFDSYDPADHFFFHLYDMVYPTYANGYQFTGLFKTIDFTSSGSGQGWFGASGLNFDLDAGYYWIEVGAYDGNGDVPAGGGAYGMFATMLQWDGNGDPIPAAQVGVYQNYNSEADMGLRILTPEAGPVAAPEPSTLALAALGLAGAFVLRRRLKG